MFVKKECCVLCHITTTIALDLLSNAVVERLNDACGNVNDLSSGDTWSALYKYLTWRCTFK